MHCVCEQEVVIRLSKPAFSPYIREYTVDIFTSTPVIHYRIYCRYIHQYTCDVQKCIDITPNRARANYVDQADHHNLQALCCVGDLRAGLTVPCLVLGTFCTRINLLVWASPIYRPNSMCAPTTNQTVCASLKNSAIWHTNPGLLV